MPNALGQKRPEDPDKPLFQEYRGIQLGMGAEEVRKKLGNPTDKGDEQDFFMLNDAESAQIFYDKTKKVMAISANFLRGAQNIPTPKVLFGEELDAKPDGSRLQNDALSESRLLVVVQQNCGRVAAHQRNAAEDRLAPGISPKRHRWTPCPSTLILTCVYRASETSIPTPVDSPPRGFSDQIRKQARELGFELVGIVPADVACLRAAAIARMACAWLPRRHVMDGARSGTAHRSA